MKEGAGTEVSQADRAVERPVRPAVSLPRVIGVAAALLLWIALLNLPTFVAGPELDPSWCQAYGHFLAHRMRAGTDYIFTYGPLGYFITAAYDRDLFWLKYAWEVGFGLLFSFRLVGLSRRAECGLRIADCGFRGAGNPQSAFPNPQSAKALFAFSFLVLLVALTPEASYVLLAAILGSGLILDEDPGIPCLALDTFLLAFLSLIKFTLFVMCAAALLAEIAYRRQRPRAILSPLTLFAAWLALLWTAAGASLLDFPRYLYAAVQVAGGYAEAMSYDGGGGLVPISFLLVLCLSAAHLVVLMSNRKDLRTALAVLFLEAVLLLSWRHALTRQDVGHVILFYLYCLFAPFLLPSLLGPQRRRLRWITVASLLMVAGGAFGVARLLRASGQLFTLGTVVPAQCVEHLQAVAAPARLQAAMERIRQRRERETALPRVRAVVGQAPLDVISTEQGVVLLNGFNWHTRPIFQSYSSYTPFLMETNAAFFRGAGAPEYVLFKLQAIDERLPAHEDGPALLEILRRYAPVLAERGYLLLRRRPEEEAPPAAAASQTLGRFDQEIPLPETSARYRTAGIRLRPSLAGKLRAILFKPPPVSITVTLEAGSSSTYHLIPTMAAQGFLLEPFLQSTADVARLYGPGPGRRVRSLRITCAGGFRSWFEDRVEVTLREPATVAGRPLERAVVEDLARQVTSAAGAPAGGAAP